jgi:hypothetical protein
MNRSYRKSSRNREKLSQSLFVVIAVTIGVLFFWAVFGDFFHTGERFGPTPEDFQVAPEKPK